MEKRGGKEEWESNSNNAKKMGSKSQEMNGNGQIAQKKNANGSEKRHRDEENEGEEQEIDENPSKMGLKEQKQKRKQKKAKMAKQEEKVEEDPIEIIKRLEVESRANKEKLNNVVKILKFAQDSKEEVIFAAIHSLGRIFSPYVEEGRFRGLKEAAQTPETKVLTWLSEKYQSFIALLLNLFNHKEPGLQVPALKILMQFVTHETKADSTLLKHYSFANSFFQPIISAWIFSENCNETFAEIMMEEFINKNDDLRFYFLRNMKKMNEQNSKEPKQEYLNHVFEALQAVRMVERQSEIKDFFTGNTEKYGIYTFEKDTRARESKKNLQEPHPHIVTDLHSHKKAFDEAWLSFLKLELTPDIYKRVLIIMYRSIIPFMANPKYLMDFLTDSYGTGGIVSILSLNALFILITKYNLDYADFYPKLYALLDQNIPHVKYRARFFRMLDIFLQSPLLPSYLIGAFAKRLSRLLLFSPPSTCVILMPLIYNLILRHPSCVSLIHRLSDQQPSQQTDILALDPNQNLRTDPFNFDEKNPFKSNAMHSSLWELETMKHHYCPNVAKFERNFEEVFKMQPFQLEKFLESSYGSLMKTEMRPMKDGAALNIDIRPSLFSKEEFVTNFWDFAPIEN